MQLGRIKTIETRDGAQWLTVEYPSGPSVTAVLMLPPGIDSGPLRGDLALVDATDGEPRVLAVIGADSSVDAGDWSAMSRGAQGDSVAVVYLGSDGSVSITNQAGSIELASGGRVTINGHVTIDP